MMYRLPCLRFAIVCVITDLKQIQRYGLCVQLAVDKPSSGRTADCDGYFLFVDTRGGPAGGKDFQIQQK